MSRLTLASGHMQHRIDFTHDGRRVVLPVSILPPTPSLDLIGYTANALIDTGSTTTGITPRVAKALALVGRGKRPLGSAQGEGLAERYLFRIAIDISLPGPAFPFVFEDIIGFELKDSFQLDALIGMDVLGHCNFTMSTKRRCSLEFGRA